jgi:hypothetical protein
MTSVGDVHRNDVSIEARQGKREYVGEIYEYPLAGRHHNARDWIQRILSYIGPVLNIWSENATIAEMYKEALALW